MFPYFLIFFFTCALLWIGQRQSQQRWNIFSTTGILLPCIFASMRGIDVGTDTSTYCYMYEQCVIAPSWEIAALRVSSEPSYYVISKLSERIGGFQTLCFIYQLITVIFFYLSAYKFRKYVKIWVAFFLYFMFIYTLSFNIMRQCAACAILLYATTSILHNKKQFWIWAIIGTVVHTSCIIAAVFIYSIDIILTAPPKAKRRLTVLYISGLLILSFAFLKLVGYIGLLGFGRMEEYSEVYGATRASYVSVTELIYRLFFAIVYTICCYKHIVNRKSALPFYLILFTELTLMSLGMYNGFLVRLAVYLTVIELFFIGSVVESKKLTHKSRAIARFMLVFVCSAYWWWTIVHNGTNAVIPYYIE